MWNHLPADALNRRSDRDWIGQNLDQLVTRHVIQGWLPILQPTDHGPLRAWKINPLTGPSQTYDRPGIEQYIRMATEVPPAGL